MVRVAQEGSSFGAQCRELQDDVPSIAGAVMSAQSPVHGPVQEGEPGGMRTGGGQGGCHRDVRDLSGMHGLGDQDGETHLESVDAGVDLLEGVSLRLVQANAVAFELLNGQADETGGLGVDDGAVGVARLLAVGCCSDEVIERLEALIEARVEMVGVGVRRQLRGEHLLELIEVRAVSGGGQGVQYCQRPLQQLTGSFQGVDGVGDRGFGLVGGDRLPLLALRSHPGTDGRFDVGVVHGREAGQAKVERPWLGEDVRLREVGAVGGLAHGPIVPRAGGFSSTTCRKLWVISPYRTA